jgi:malate synthase
MTGQQNLRDAVNKTITLEDAAKHKTHKLNDQTAVLLDLEDCIYQRNIF